MPRSNVLPKAAVLAALIALLLVPPAPRAHAAKTTSINVVSSITSLTFNQNGQLVATGTATAVIHGKTYTVPFTAPANISLAADQSGAAAAGCPILDLTLGPINLNLLGLVVQTSPICLTITAYGGVGNLLGNLLCSIANALNGGLSLQQILGSLALADLNNLLSGLAGLFSGALLNTVLQSIQAVNSGHTCSILNLTLGPFNLNLLGLDVNLDNCSGGPVTVTITAVTGPGNLLGNLLCELVDGNLLNLGATLQGILQQIVGLLTA